MLGKHVRPGFVCALTVAALALPASAGASITGLPRINPNPTFSLPFAPSATATNRTIASPFAPVTGTSWAGAFDTTVTPPDPNGAIGPSNYVEIINLQMAIYTRSGVLVNKSALGTLTGHSQFNLSDPMVLWDAATQRFYYNVWDTSRATMAWGFSKSASPSGPTSFCNYTSSFGYSTSEFPDYPKLGQSNGFLMIGVNHYANQFASSSDRSDLLWIDKPQGSGTITTCPAASTFLAGKFANLRNQDGTQAFTPVPAIEDDSLGNGYVVASHDIECPPTCGSGNIITLFVVRPSSTNASIPTIVATHSITVPTYAAPSTAGAPQKGTTNRLDTLDGRLEHAVAATNPTIGHVVIWTGHSIAGTGGLTQFRWYEINPLPLTAPTLVTSGSVSSSSLYVFNGAMAPDRTVTPTGSAHGDSVVIGFSTSSSTTLPADQMVSIVGGGTQSPFVLVHQSATADNDFSCSPCRWGDYGGATSDPLGSELGNAHGEVWLTNEAVTSGNNTTWNWEAKP
jgi:hypothetical protein